MESKEVFYQDLAMQLDSWIANLTEAVSDPQADLIWTDNPDAFKVVREALQTKQATESFRSVVSEGLRGLLHSVLVTLDGGSKLAETTNLRILDDSGSEFPRHMHEEFVGYLMDTGRLK